MQLHLTEHRKHVANLLLVILQRVTEIEDTVLVDDAGYVYETRDCSMDVNLERRRCFSQPEWYHKVFKVTAPYTESRVPLVSFLYSYTMVSTAEADFEKYFDLANLLSVSVIGRGTCRFPIMPAG